MAVEARHPVTLSEEILHTLLNPLLTAEAPIHMTLLERIHSLERERATLLLLVGDMIRKNQALREMIQR